LETPEKQKKSEIDQILTSVCCPGQNEHRDIKKVANNHVIDILDRCQKGQNFVALFLLLLGHTLFPHDFSGTIVAFSALMLLVG